MPSSASVASTLSGQFSAPVRERGQQYFRQNRVLIRSGTSTRLNAEVRGSETYPVQLAESNGRFEMRCECPFFYDKGHRCKHLWAAILAADEQGYLMDAAAAMNQTRPAAKPVPPPAWKTQLSRIAQRTAPVKTEEAPWAAGTEVVYLVDISKSQATENVVLTIARRKAVGEGMRYPPKPVRLDEIRLARVPCEEDRELLSLLIGGRGFDNFGHPLSNGMGSNTFSMPPMLERTLLARIVQTGRCFLPFDDHDWNKPALQWDDGEPWQFQIDVRGDVAAGWRMQGRFHRGAEELGIHDVVVASKGGFLITHKHVARWQEDGSSPWIEDFRRNGSIAISEQEREEFFNGLLCSPALPALNVPELWRYEEVTVVPRPSLRLFQPRYASVKDGMRAELSFGYEDRTVEEHATVRGIYLAASRRFIRRDINAEETARTTLSALGLAFSAGNWSDEAGWSLARKHVPRVARALLEEGWQVFAEGAVFRQPDAFQANVSSGIDWFELHASAAFGEEHVALPKLLAALRRGEMMVTLDDGSHGLLPEDWLRRFGTVAALGEAEGDLIRFRPSQAGVLDALLATMPAVDCDEQFRHVRQQLQQFQTIGPAPQPAGFCGMLRDYQREGLGWMHFLRQFGLGGCLADDMGVGKTAQVLALLETRRELRASGEVEAPSLVVVPKSLVFNWKQEVARFTPHIRVLDYTGVGRNKGDLRGCDLILTTYGTLRRDAVHFKDVVFDYVILDEAQAVKNAKTESAKAVRLLRSRHRLALSGTPVENHLGELWSLLEFLNPGMLGSFAAFQGMRGGMRNSDEDTRTLLARAIRPFLLRRTKEQVARELPAKVEQTIYCEMEAEQKSMYDGLRDHYRTALLGKIERDGIARSKIQVLEALLRLRQAACHPGLIDHKLQSNTSAKLDVLLEQLKAVLEEGHKALVFSQFTSLLAIVRSSLDKDGIPYEYLDGKTRDRQACVQRFQNEAECRLFLISLKAGGVGLNLTAADYVFILDPWWNPAVEAQAVDRTHRIGQTRQVFAYRLITRDTVEEKVLLLQDTKRDLADAIIGAQNSLIGELRAEDIALLLS